MSCVLCNRRKEKRFCLAVHGRICPQCCGEQREVTLDCPSECPYLQQSRLHDRRRPQDAGGEELFPEIEISPQFMRQHEPAAISILQGIASVARGDRNLTDREVSGALTNMIKTYQTMVESGLLYQESLANPVQGSLINSIEGLLKEYRQLEEQHLGFSSLKDGDVLKGLVWVLRLVFLNSSGRPRSRGFLDFLRELLPGAHAASPANVPGTRIILP